MFEGSTLRRVSSADTVPKLLKRKTKSELWNKSELREEKNFWEEGTNVLRSVVVNTEKVEKEIVRKR